MNNNKSGYPSGLTASMMRLLILIYYDSKYSECANIDLAYLYLEDLIDRNDPLAGLTKKGEVFVRRMLDTPLPTKTIVWMYKGDEA